MSKNLAQVFAANPITTIGNTDLLYVVTTGTTDAAINGLNFKAQFSPLTTKGDLYTFSTVNARLAVGTTNGQLLQVNSAAATGLSWSSFTFSAGGNITFSGAFTFTGTVTGNTSVTFPTSGTLATTSQFLIYNDVAGTSQAAAVNNGYIISNALQTTVTLPATASEGSIIAVQGKGAAGWILAANAGQTINLGNSPSTVGGSLTSTNQWDAVEVVCVTADTVWAVKSVIGNLSVG